MQCGEIGKNAELRVERPELDTGAAMSETNNNQACVQDPHRSNVQENHALVSLQFYC